MSAVKLRAGARPFYAAGRRIKAAEIFDADLAIAADLVTQGRASPVDAVGSVAIAAYRKADHEATVRRIEAETRPSLHRVA